MNTRPISVKTRLRAAAQRLTGSIRVQVRRFRHAPLRVLLLKTWNDHLGDMVLISGTLRHYRALYPGHRLELACPDAYIGYFQRCPYLDAVVPLSRYGTIKQHYPERSPCNAGRHDQVISLRRTPTHRDYLRLESLRPAWTAGMTGDWLQIDEERAKLEERRLNCKASIPTGLMPMHELEAQRCLLQALGAKIESSEELFPECWIEPATERRADEWLQRAKDRGPVVVCAPCGSKPIRDWKLEHWHETLRALPACTVVLVGSERDRHFMEKMDWRGLPSVSRINLIGKTSINELAAVLARGDLVISAESAVFHLAATLRRPAICVAGGGHWGRFVPWGLPDRTRVLTQARNCIGCGWRCRQPMAYCIQEVTPAAVVENALELLSLRFSLTEIGSSISVGVHLDAGPA